MIVRPNKLLFEQIADYFQEMIGKGVYPKGAALPSVREVALQEGVNPNTVVKAYGLLDERGLVMSVPKKGYFVRDDLALKSEVEESIRSLIQKGHSIDEIQEVINRLKGGNND